MKEGNETKTIKASELTGECWMVQFYGYETCRRCQNRVKGCTGTNIRRSGKNNKGVEVGAKGIGATAN